MWRSCFELMLARRCEMGPGQRPKRQTRTSPPSVPQQQQQQQQQQRLGASIVMKAKFKVANININLVNEPYDAHKEEDFHFGDTTFRQDGFSIGQDYMRFEGSTLTRGELAPHSLAIDASLLIGEGAFSKVRLGIFWCDLCGTSTRKPFFPLTNFRTADRLYRL
jgi:hypothetical protein